MGNAQSFFAKYGVDALVVTASLILFVIFGYFPIWFSHFVFSSPINSIAAILCGLAVALAPILLRRRTLHWAVVTTLACAAIVGSFFCTRPLSSIDREFATLEQKAQTGAGEAATVISRMEDIASQTGFWRYAGIVGTIYSSTVKNPEKAMKYAQAAYDDNHGAIATEAMACAYMASGKKDQALSFIAGHPLIEIRSFYLGRFAADEPCIQYGQRAPASK